MKKLTLIFLMLLIASYSFSQDLMKAVRDNDTIAMRIAIEKGADLNEKDDKGYTPLIIAVYNNQFEAANWLLQKGVQVDAADQSGNTALMGAAFKGMTPLVELLLEKDANPHILNGNQANALFFAVTFGHEAIVNILLQYKVDIRQKDRFGKTVYDHAVLQENENMIKLLQ